MKKTKIIKFIIFLFVAFYPFTIAKAYLKSVSRSNMVIHNDEINDGSYLLMCSYVHNSDTDRYERINIYYAYGANWLVSWDEPGVQKTRDKKGNYNKVFSNKGDNIYISDSDIENLIENGVCPESAWVDISFGWDGNELCFGGRDYCKSKKNFATEFATKDVTSEKNYDFNDEMETYFNKYNMGINTCDEFRKKEANIEEKIKTDFIKNFLKYEKNEEIPSFIQNNQTYKDGMERIKTKYVNAMKAKCDLEVLADSSLSNEEKQDLLGQNQSALNEAMGQVENIEDEIRVDIDISIPVRDTSCKVLFDDGLGDMLGKAFSLIKFAVPVLIIALGIIDYVKGIASQNQDEIQKTTIKMGKRLAIGLIIFLLPTILNFILTLLGYDESCFDWLK